MIAEPQERGAWHCHVIYIFEKKHLIFLITNLAKYGDMDIRKLQS